MDLVPSLAMEVGTIRGRILAALGRCVDAGQAMTALERSEVLDRLCRLARAECWRCLPQRTKRAAAVEGR